MKYATAVLILAAFGCKPVLREGGHAGFKYEVDSTDTKTWDNSIEVIHHTGSWYTRSDSARDLHMFDLRNGGTEDMCINMYVERSDGESDAGVWGPDNFVLHPGETRRQVAGLASSRSDGMEINMHLTSWRAAVDPQCTNH